MVKDYCEAFSELYSIRWETEIACHASRTLYLSKKNKTKELPLLDDVKILTKYLSKAGNEAKICLTDKTIEPIELKQVWVRLAEVTLTSIILFNRRRQGEAFKMTIKDYTDGIGEKGHNEDLLTGLSKLEQALCRQMTRIEITGKRGRIVPVMLTAEMKSFTDILLEMRDKAGVAEHNTFFFARVNCESDSHIRGSDCLRKFTEEVPLKEPLLIRSTTLRKQIATYTQLVNLNENELDVVAQYMGHDIRIHREHYRLPNGTVQMAKVSRLLLAMEKGEIPDMREKEDKNHSNCKKSQPEESEASEDSDEEKISLPGEILFLIQYSPVAEP